MAPRAALFQHRADLELAASRERQLARQRLHPKRSGEILITCMAFPLNAPRGGRRRAGLASAAAPLSAARASSAPASHPVPVR